MLALWAAYMIKPVWTVCRHGFNMLNELLRLKSRKHIIFVALFLLLPAVFPGQIIARIAGFSDATGKALDGFFDRHKETAGRKVAVFDLDGTLMGQVPYYAADEFFLQESEAGLITPQCLPETAGVSPSSSAALNYVAIGRELGHKYGLLWRVKTLKGQKAAAVSRRAMDFYTKHYLRKIFAPMKELVDILHEKGFEVWVITGSPEIYVNEFVSLHFGIHPCRVIGSRTIIHDGTLTDIPAGPSMHRDGKVEAIETFIKAKPLLVAGNAVGDLDMLKFSRDLSMVINPPTALRKKSEELGWLIELIPDSQLPDSPRLHLKYGLSLNN
ncbi:MAG: haloacid dehalogenase-like hydrolase [bacterium]